MFNSTADRPGFLQGDEHAAVNGSPAHRSVLPAWKPDAALEPALRQLEAEDHGSRQPGRQYPAAGHGPRAAFMSTLDSHSNNAPSRTRNQAPTCTLPTLH